MTNSDVFNVLVCRILEQVCSNFPLETDLLAKTFIADIEGDDKQKVESFYNTVRWLEKYGYIDIKSKTLEYDFYMVTPSEKTMIIMKTIPNQLHTSDKPKTLFDHIKACVTSGTSEAFQDVVKNTIAIGISTIVSS